MKLREEKELHQQLSILLTYLVERREDNFHLNYGLNKNLSILSLAVAAIDKGISQELKDLETKILKLGNDKKEEVSKLNIDEELTQIEGISSEEVMCRKDILVKDPFIVGLSFSLAADRLRHSELMKEYTTALEEEDDTIELYKLNAEKLETAGVKLEFSFMTVLLKFL